MIAVGDLRYDKSPSLIDPWIFIKAHQKWASLDFYSVLLWHGCYHVISNDTILIVN